MKTLQLTAHVAADGMSATFRLRSEARFADGSPVTADDVAFSFDQRGPGYPRLVGSAMDIGAFEVQAPAVPLSFGTASSLTS